MVRSEGFRGFRVETEHLKKTLGRRRDATGNPYFFCERGQLSISPTRPNSTHIMNVKEYLIVQYQPRCGGGPGGTGGAAPLPNANGGA